MSRYLRILALCSTSFIAANAWAQTPVPPVPPTPPAGMAAQAPMFDPQQLPAYKGTVQQFTLTPRGDIDGIIMTDGTEVKVPPHLSTQIAYIVKPGDAVTVRGLRAASLPLIAAASITNDASGSAVVDTGPGDRLRGVGRPPLPPVAGRDAPPPPPLVAGRDAPPPAAPNLTAVQGRVKMVLHGPQGEVNGALLEDRTVLRLPPHEAGRFTSLLAAGQTVAVRGDISTTALGTVLEVRAIGASPDQLSDIASSPPPRADRGPRDGGPRGPAGGPRGPRG